MSINISGTLPRFIAIVGNPGAGKSEVQRILFEDFGVQPVDDGDPLRDFAMRHLGLSWEDCNTQEGKKRFTEINGVEHENRKILGNLGAQLEDLFGDFIMPWIAAEKLPPVGSFSFGSVRRNQPYFYKQRGGIVIEVRNPSALPSGNDWDEFVTSETDFVINNDALVRGMSHADAIEDLRQKVFDVIESVRQS